MGKKKKGLSNKLARMSDDERARYLQHRAQIEEEAKRRKEQLIATYMKNKIKREEAFMRLNVAKINEHWHQILRKVKVKELRLEIENLRSWITKVIDMKNSIIKRLMDELDEAEQQYRFNLQSHLSHLDHVIEIHHSRQDDLQNDFDRKKNTVLDEARAELEFIKEQARAEEEYLKLVLFAMRKKFDNTQKQVNAYREAKLEDISTTLKAELQTMAKNYGTTMDKIWQDINATLSEYLTSTSVRRHHYIELKHLDDRNTAERENNERKIARYDEVLAGLKAKFYEVSEFGEEDIKGLRKELEELTTSYDKTRKDLTVNIIKDDKKLKDLTIISNEVLNKFQNLSEKGLQLLQMVKCCRRLETEDEKLIKWAVKYQNFEADEDEEEQNQTQRSRKDDDDLEQKCDFDEKASENSDDTATSKTSQEKKSKFIFPEGFTHLEKLDGLWLCYNRVELDIMQLKSEKSSLLRENRKLKEIIKDIIEKAAMEKSLPVPVQMEPPKVFSAPILITSSQARRIPQIPSCVVLHF